MSCDNDYHCRCTHLSQVGISGHVADYGAATSQSAEYVQSQNGYAVTRRLTYCADKLSFSQRNERANQTDIAQNCVLNAISICGVERSKTESRRPSERRRHLGEVRIELAGRRCHPSTTDDSGQSAVCGVGDSYATTMTTSDESLQRVARARRHHI